MKEFIVLAKEATWDGRSITVWVVAPRGRIKCEIPRPTIHAHRLFQDALTREIARDRDEIVERLHTALLTKAAKSTSAIIRIEPSDV